MELRFHSSGHHFHPLRYFDARSVTWPAESALFGEGWHVWHARAEFEQESERHPEVPRIELINHVVPCCHRKPFHSALKLFFPQTMETFQDLPGFRFPRSGSHVVFSASCNIIFCLNFDAQSFHQAVQCPDSLGVDICFVVTALFQDDCVGLRSGQDMTSPFQIGPTSYWRSSFLYNDFIQMGVVRKHAHKLWRNSIFRQLLSFCLCAVHVHIDICPVSSVFRALDELEDDMSPY